MGHDLDLAIAYSCVGVPLILLFLLRRGHMLIKRRHPFLSALSALYGIFFTSIVLIRHDLGAEHFPYPLYMWSIFLLFPLYLGPYIIRAYLLVVVFGFSNLRFLSGLSRSQDGINYEQHHRRMQEKLKFPYLFGIFTLLFTISFVPALVFQLLWDRQKSYVTDEMIALIILTLVYMSIIAYGIYRMRSIDDAFTLSKELKFCVVAWVAAGGMFFTMNLISAFVAWEQNSFAAAYTIIVCIMVTFLFTIVYPLIRTFFVRSEKKPLSFIRDESGVAACLDHSTYRSMFISHLHLVSCADYALCYDLIQEYKTVPNAEEASEMMQQIMEYIDSENATVLVSSVAIDELRRRSESYKTHDVPARNDIIAPVETLIHRTLANYFSEFLRERDMAGEIQAELAQKQATERLAQKTGYV